MDKNLTVATRKTDITHVKRRGIHTKARREPWMKVISTKWLDVNKVNNLELFVFGTSRAWYQRRCAALGAKPKGPVKF